MTNNKKFELFYDDMISIGLEPTQVKKNINQYMSKLEAHFNSAMIEQKAKTERLKKSYKTKIGQATKRADERSELEDILIDAIEKTKIQVLKRRLVAERLLNKKDRKLSVQINEMSQGVLTGESSTLLES